jgi:CubicO group peptidase (beta-lactamase class C family)
MIPLQQAESVLYTAIREGAFPGAAYGISVEGKIVALSAIGRFTYQPSAPAMQPTTIFDLASVSKVIATTAMAMLLFEAKTLRLDMPVCSVLPDFAAGDPAGSPRRAVTVEMLLAHSSGLPAHRPLYEQCMDRQQVLDACLQMPLEAAPGSRALYSDIGFILLGVLLEQLVDTTLDIFSRQKIFAPLGMNASAYRPQESLRPQIPPTCAGDFLSQGIVQGVVHDENCRIMGGVAGHAGIFANAEDCLRFAACMLQEGAPLFHPETVQRFTTRVSSPAGTSRALGWDTPSSPSSSGSFFSARSAGHLGYTGTSLWLDFGRQLAAVLLTNRTWPGSQPRAAFDRIREVRPAFHDAVMRELHLASPGNNSRYI